MQPRRPLPSFRQRLLYDCRTEIDRLRKGWKFYAIFLPFLGLGTSIIAAIRMDAEFHELPLVLVAGMMHALGYVGLYSVIWIFVISKVVYEDIYESKEQKWIEREAQRRPNQSFQVAHWRFQLVAAPAAAATFLLLIAPMITLIFVLPLQNDVISRAIFSILPSD